MRTEGDYTITTVVMHGGLLIANHIKTAASEIGTLTMNDGARVDASQNKEAQTFDTVNMNKGSSIKRDDTLTISTLNLEADLHEMILR